MTRGQDRLDVVVVGGGVIGLTTALLLARSGRHVGLWAEQVGQGTTSAVAAAVWEPYRAFPMERVRAWATASLDHFRRLSDDPGTGVRWEQGLRVSPSRTPDPWWAPVVDDFRVCQPDELPDGFPHGVGFSCPVVEMPIYLAWLERAFVEEGGLVRRRRLETLEEAVAPVVVNCPGLGARTLVPDETVYPVRGQVVRVHNPGLRRFVVSEDHPDGLTYVIPRSTDCVLGGTATEHDWSIEPDGATADAILRRALDLEPRLAGCDVVGHAAGLRPARPAVRLEIGGLQDGRPVIHNYGHGGGGVTLSWGCAESVATLLDAL